MESVDLLYTNYEKAEDTLYLSRRLQSLLDRFGYVCVGADYPLSIGEVYESLGIQIVIIGVSSRSEYEEQCKYADGPTNTFLYYYRTTAE